MDFQEKRADDLASLKAEIRAVRLERVLPLGSWWRDQPWNLLWVRWFLAYALFPFALIHLIEGSDFEWVNLAFGIYFALTWLIVLTLCMRPDRVDVGLLIGTALFTAVVGAREPMEPWPQSSFIASMASASRSIGFNSPAISACSGFGRASRPSVVSTRPAGNPSPHAHPK